MEDEPKGRDGDGGASSDDDEDRRAILARRRAFVVSALAGLAMGGTTDCAGPEPGARAPREIFPRTVEQPVSLESAQPQVCLMRAGPMPGDEEPPYFSGTWVPTDGGDAGDAGDASADVSSGLDASLATDAGDASVDAARDARVRTPRRPPGPPPMPCLTPVRPRPCLTPARPRPCLDVGPSVCLLMTLKEPPEDDGGEET